MRRLVPVLLAAALVLAPLGAQAADLVVWWEKGYYAQEDEAVPEIIAAFEQETGKQVELVFHPEQGASGQDRGCARGRPAARLRLRLPSADYIAQWAFDDRLVDLTDAVGHFSDMFDPDALAWVTLRNAESGQEALYGLPVGRMINYVHVWKSLLEGPRLQPAEHRYSVPLPRHFRIGIIHRADDARDARGNDRVRTGRRFAVVRAGFKRHIERRAARRLACLRQRLGFRMRTAAIVRPGAAEDHAVLDHDGAHGRIRPRASEPTPTEGQRKLHEAKIVRARHWFDTAVSRMGFSDLLAVKPRAVPFENGDEAFQIKRRRCYFRTCAGRGSSSPDNSPSTASKSFASRKLR